MLRVIFDTNIYGLIAEDEKGTAIAEKIFNDKEFIVYGFQIIRKELRDTPKGEKLGKLNKRNYLLHLYDELTKGRYLNDSIQINKLALKFYNSFRQFGGIKTWQDIKNDFTIVACAHFYKLELIISDDSRTLLSKPALKAFKHISIKEGLWSPSFWKYSELRSKYISE